jgi:hypothetical protein
MTADLRAFGGTGPGLTAPTPRPAVALGWVAAIVVVGAAATLLGSPYLLVAGFVVLFLGAIYVLSPGDPATVLSLTALTGFVVPARYIVEALGDAGAPVTMLSVGCFAWWLSSRVAGTSGLAAGYNPVRLGAFIMMGTMLVAYIAAWARPIDGVEGRNADRTLIVWFGYLGVLLLCTDGVLTRARLDTVLRRLVTGAMYMSLVGALQFFVRLDLTEVLVPPGLSFNTPEFTSNFLRSDFKRISGTAMHPIEFSVVAAAILPLAIHYAFNDTHRSRLARWAPVAVIGFSVPLAVSRSGILGIIVVGVFMIPALPANRRMQLVGLAVAAGFAMTVAVPGLLGTLKSFFLIGEADNSISARTQDYELVTQFFNHSPIWGQGFATFVPSQFDFLDNQYLLTIVEAGLLGLIGLALLFFAGIAATRTIRKRATDHVTRDLAQALMASVLVHVFTFATYDAMVFRTTGLSLFLVLGAIGSLWRLTPAPEQAGIQPAMWTGASA